MRADVLLVARGLFESRARAQAAIAAGLVTADAGPVRKASDKVRVDAVLLAQEVHPYVSRGGLKLAEALDVFGIDPAGRFCLDVGASTGGFTDVLLKRGAAHVTAVDTGRGQLHPSLRGLSAITMMEGTDVRGLAPDDLPNVPDLAAIDVSFIPLALVLPAVACLLAQHAVMIVLVKPQFEVGQARIGKNGVVKDEAARLSALASAESGIAALGWDITGARPSPIAGGDGNIDDLVAARR